MNQLSWLLYIGNVVGNLGPVFVIAGLLVLAVVVASFTGYYLEMDKRHPYDKEDNTRHVKRARAVRLLGILLVPVCLLFLCLAALCPSSDTVYAIAASQVGQEALQTPTGIKATQAINLWLDRQIHPAPVPESQ